MVPSPVSRRSLLVTLLTVCGQFAGCCHKSHRPLHTWVREPFDECGAAAVPTLVLPTLGEGPWDLRRDFQRALSSQLRKSKLMRIEEAEPPTDELNCTCPPRLTTWDEQLATLGTVQATQAVCSRISYFQPTAPVKLGIVVELRDVVTRASLRQVEGLWDAPHCHPPLPAKWRMKRVCEPTWSDELHQISPRQLLEQAALEISHDLPGINSIGQTQVTCTGGVESISTR